MQRQRPGHRIWSFHHRGLLLLAAADLLSVIPTAVVLRQRMKEIEGGELDAARKY